MHSPALLRGDAQDEARTTAGRQRTPCPSLGALGRSSTGVNGLWATSSLVKQPKSFDIASSAPEFCCLETSNICVRALCGLGGPRRPSRGSTAVRTDGRRRGPWDTRLRQICRAPWGRDMSTAAGVKLRWWAVDGSCRDTLMSRLSPCRCCCGVERCRSSTSARQVREPSVPQRARRSMPIRRNL